MGLDGACKYREYAAGDFVRAGVVAVGAYSGEKCDWDGEKCDWDGEREW